MRWPIRFNPLRPRELDRTVLLLATWGAVLAISWALRPPWQVAFALIMTAHVVTAELLRRYYRDIRREQDRRQADRAG